MSRTLTLLFTLLALLPSRALAQTGNPNEGVASTNPKWDFMVTTGLFESRPEHDGPRYYGDDWYGAVRGGISVGRYWTPNLKTEVEVITSGEGRRYVSREVRLPDGSMFPYGSQEYFRLSQGSARVVWQLLDNRWVHPYVLGGVAVDVERQHGFVAEQYRYPPASPGTPSLREVLVRQQVIGPRTVHRTGVMIGGGAKMYFSSRAFANSALLITHAKPAKTVSLTLGFGLDF